MCAPIDGPTKTQECFTPCKNAPAELNTCDQPSQEVTVPSPVNDSESRQGLEALQTNKSAGADNVHPVIVKWLRDIVTKSIYGLFWATIKQGRMVVDRKLTTVAAIHKGG